MKKTFVKFIASVTCMALISGSALSGCASQSSSTSSAAQSSPASAAVASASGSESSTSGKKPKIAFIPQLIGIPYFTAMQKGGEQAAKDLGVDFIYTGSTTASAPDQSRIMDSLIRQKVDAISLSVLDSSSINPIIQKAQQAGIKVYTSDSDSPDSTRDFYVAQALDEDLGYTLIDRLAAHIGGSGKIGIVSGTSTATNLNNWINYMKERVKQKYPNISIVDVQYTTSSEDALKKAQGLIVKYPDLKGLVAVASTTIPGVCQAVQQASKAGKIDVIGYGSPKTVAPYISSGIMKESILWDAKALGYLTVWAGAQVAAGKSFSAENKVPGFDKPVKYLADKKILLLGDPLVISKDNVNSFDF